jgi:hypothetical protein
LHSLSTRYLFFTRYVYLSLDLWCLYGNTNATMGFLIESLLASLLIRAIMLGFYYCIPVCLDVNVMIGLPASLPLSSYLGTRLCTVHCCGDIKQGSVNTSYISCHHFCFSHLQYLISFLLDTYLGRQSSQASTILLIWYLYSMSELAKVEDVDARKGINKFTQLFLLLMSA